MTGRDGVYLFFCRQGNEEMIVGIVPTKKRSVGLPHKNLRDLVGQPLFSHVVVAGLQAKRLDQLVVPTDSQEIQQVTLDLGATVMELPPELTRDHIPPQTAAQYALENLPAAEVMVLLMATSPLLLSQDIDDCVELFLTHRPQCVAAMTEVPPLSHYYGAVVGGNRRITWQQPIVGVREGVTRQELAARETIYRPAGVWVIDRETVFRWGTVYTEDMLAVFVPPERGIDINNEIDLTVAATLLASRRQG